MTKDSWEEQKRFNISVEERLKRVEAKQDKSDLVLESTAEMLGKVESEQQRLSVGVNQRLDRMETQQDKIDLNLEKTADSLRTIEIEMLKRSGVRDRAVARIETQVATSVSLLKWGIASVIAVTGIVVTILLTVLK